MQKYCFYFFLTFFAALYRQILNQWRQFVLTISYRRLTPSTSRPTCLQMKERKHVCNAVSFKPHQNNNQSSICEK